MKTSFADSQFMTAEEKRLVLKQWKTFLKHGCKRQHFTSRLYKHLINHCSFIAHYNQGGFYRTYFERGDMVVKFLSQFDHRNASTNRPSWTSPDLKPGIPPSFEYGSTYWATGDYADINKAMINVAAEYIPALLKEAQDRQRQGDISQAEALLAKHGIAIEHGGHQG